MAGHNILVIGASLGGVEALAQLVHGLPADLPAAVFVVLHVQADSTSQLPKILSRAGPLPAAHPSDGDRIQNGRIYVAPPDHHLLVKHGCMRVVRGPRENRSRPALDPLFRTAARAYGPCVVGVVLTGKLDDGTAGLDAVKMRGGVTIVQDPADAECAEMPLHALRHVAIDYCVPLVAIPPLLSQLAQQAADNEEVAPVSRDLELEAEFAEMDTAVLQRSEPPGVPAGFTGV
jgi:two-component system, chemotaxis family, protein-glutamate methylesterase/glutaminase